MKEIVHIKLKKRLSVGIVIKLLYCHTHNSWCRVTCECGAENMQRMSGRYRLYRLKTIDKLVDKD